MKLTSHLTLPPDTVTRTIGILAQKGAGKTYTAMKLTEEMLAAKQQVVCLDPTGAWWGLRRSDDPKRAAPDILIMGGDHGDVPLEPTSGEVIAQFIVDTGRSVVLDLSHFESNAAQNRFVTAFALKLYRLKAHSRTPLHLMIDEADSFVPQRPQPGEQAMLGAFEAIVRRGRSRGMGMTMISQRPAVVNKNVLTQVDALICHRVTGKQDMDALTDWVKHWQPKKDQAEQFLASLPSLDVGEMWFWSPGWHGTFQRGQVLKRRTHDSSSTPEAGADTSEIKLRPVDLGELTEQIKATVQRAKENDPKELRAKISIEQATNRVLTATIEKLKTAQPAPLETIKGVPLLTDKDRELLTETAAKIEAFHNSKVAAEFAVGHVVRLLTFVEGRAAELQHKSRAAGPAPKATTRQMLVNHCAQNGTLTKCERALLTVLAQYSPSSCEKRKISLVSGYSVRSSSFENGLSQLRTKGYAEGSDPLRITDAGMGAIGSFDALPTGAEAIRHWIRQLSKCEGTLLAALLDAPGHTLTKEELSEVSGYSLTSSSFENGLSQLRTRELIEGSRTLTLLIS